jgi:hypothetical protein
VDQIQKSISGKCSPFETMSTCLRRIFDLVDIGFVKICAVSAAMTLM